VTSAARPDPVCFGVPAQVIGRAVARVAGDAIRATVGCWLNVAARVCARGVLSPSAPADHLPSYSPSQQHLLMRPTMPFVGAMSTHGKGESAVDRGGMGGSNLQDVPPADREPGLQRGESGGVDDQRLLPR